jgi:uncharacterized membrane protein YhfC
MELAFNQSNVLLGGSFWLLSPYTCGLAALGKTKNILILFDQDGQTVAPVFLVPLRLLFLVDDSQANASRLPKSLIPYGCTKAAHFEELKKQLDSELPGT